MTGAPGLRADQLTTELRDADRVFRLDVSNLHLAPGTVVALGGPSGSGKTLLLELLGLLRRPNPPARFSFHSAGGKVTDLAHLWSGRSAELAATRGRLFGFVPQSGGLLPFLTVAENIRLTQRIAGREEPQWVDSLLETLGLASIRHLRPGALSIGQRQRTAIARALAHRPALILADEPTAALDPDASDTVMRLFLSLAHGTGCGVFLSSHDLDLVDRHGISRLSLVVETHGNRITSRLEGLG
jgi:putative ABC transport system ATP-binding protein